MMIVKKVIIYLKHCLLFFISNFQDEWDSERDQALLKVEKLHCRNWEMIAKNISGNYSAGQLENKFKHLQEKHIEIMEHKIKIEDQNTEFSEKEWSENEKALVQLESMFPQNWEMVSKNIGGNQSSNKVRARFMRLHDLIPEVFFLTLNSSMYLLYLHPYGHNSYID